MEIRVGMRVIIVKATGDLRSYEMVKVSRITGDNIVVEDMTGELHTVRKDNIQVLLPDPDHH